MVVEVFLHKLLALEIKLRHDEKDRRFSFALASFGGIISYAVDTYYSFLINTKF